MYSTLLLAARPTFVEQRLIVGIQIYYEGYRAFFFFGSSCRVWGSRGRMRSCEGWSWRWAHTHSFARYELAQSDSMRLVGYYLPSGEGSGFPSREPWGGVPNFTSPLQSSILQGSSDFKSTPSRLHSPRRSSPSQWSLDVRNSRTRVMHRTSYFHDLLGKSSQIFGGIHLKGSSPEIMPR
jgi:hypothetical protein